MAQTLKEQAYQCIRQKILNGDLPAGKQVSEYSLSKDMGLGRTPVREAIAQLEIEGYFERLPRFGTIVKTPTLDDVAELYDLRIALESYAACQAARVAEPEQIQRLDRLCTELELIGESAKDSGMEFLDLPSLRRFRVADMGFHIILIQTTGNRRIMKIVADTHVMTTLFSLMDMKQDYESVQSALSYHRGILEAVKRSEEDTARLLMINHIRSSKKGSLEHLRSAQRESAAQQTAFPELPPDVVKELDRIEEGIAAEE
ncbi:MAG: GntR family transcriptional regulator [bacterium]